MLLSGLLVEYDIHQHVASDIATDTKYLPVGTYNIQSNINKIAQWTDKNFMKLNEAKCKFMIFTRTKESFTTSLSVNPITPGVSDQ